ncbi:MAG: replication restart helicase PriA [Dissulfurimicrobium sp.]|uniref:replication restart helicase PriA n=1 Tax=Dissulfurimicrobium sp. TaxID=2022436 RepID=UPI00404A7698
MGDETRRLIDVVLPLPIEHSLTYALKPDVQPPQRGSRVLVPVGRRQMIGMVWGMAEGPPPHGVKEILEIIDETQLLPESLIKFLEWASSYYFYPIGRVIAEALPPGFLSSKARRIVDITKIKRRFLSKRPVFPVWSNEINITPTSEQAAALGYIEQALLARSYSPILLHGVTGSGKTEIYLRAAQICLQQQKGVIFMVPEIAMTAQAVGRFIARFGDAVTVLHSALTEHQRQGEWLRIRRGESRIVIGTRSAIFAPVQDVGLLIVDEEHDASYKQEDRFKYNARDMAVMRASMSGATVILGSATPSISSYTNAISGRYHLITLERRVDDRPLPHVTVVDRRKAEKEKKGLGGSAQRRPAWLTDVLEAAIGETLDKGEQVLLFLNRRGFATHVFCPDCGHVFKCPHCDVSLVWHRRGQSCGLDEFPGVDCGDSRSGKAGGALICHYCGRTWPAMPICPRCEGHAVKAVGYGTERLANDIAKIFPLARLARLDRDMVRGRRSMEGVLRDFHDGHLDILIGTQMVSKGHDFPGLTLVGIVWADMSLNFPEYKAAEQTFQLLIQVAGRVGRSSRPGRVIIQTFMPDHYVLECVTRHNYQAFYEKEVALRKKMCYPPFGRLINLRFSSRNDKLLEKTVFKIADIAKEAISKASGGLNVEIFGPSPAPRARIKDRFRWQILLKAGSIADMRALCTMLISMRGELIPASVAFEMDVDPVSLL